mmetsp:Transcript_29929/g.64075  ORF Transcript_29929/g.64075 Transcript_29929/m.64075 type:complete len:227 (-) Transcript_29929:453-1133(-)
MKIWPTGNDTTNNSGSPDAAVGYSRVQLVDPSQTPTDLFVYNANFERVRLCSGWWSEPEAWLGDGRPRELSSLPLATWSLLTTSVKEYQSALLEVQRRIIRRLLIPIYIIWAAALVSSSQAYGAVNPEKANNAMLLINLCFLLALFGTVLIARHFTQNHAKDVFQPGVDSVLRELDRPLAESGFDVKLVSGANGGDGKPSSFVLRFTPLRDEDKNAEATAAFENSV